MKKKFALEEKVRILFLIHDLGGGGAERVLVNLVNHLSQEKFDITVMSLFGGGVNEKFLKDGIHYKAVFRCSFPGNSRLMKFFSPSLLHRFFIKEHYDIEVAYLEGPCTRIVSGCPEKNTRLVAWVHNDFSLEQNNPYASFRSKHEAQTCYARFDNVVGVSWQVVADLRKFYPALQSSEVLYNTNETEKILQLGDEPLLEELFSKDAVNFVSAGRLTAQKSFDRLLAALGEIAVGYPEVPRFHLYLLGKGKDEEKLRRQAQELGIGERVTFLGFQENPYKFIKKADVYVCSSLHEGFSTAVTEALVLGKPVVATRISGMEELLGTNGEHGIVVENSTEGLREGILRMLKNEVREHFAKTSVMCGKEFSTEKTVKTVEEMLLRLARN